MVRFLLDENISYKTALFLRSLGHDVKTIVEFGLSGASDQEVVRKTIQTKRILNTLDSDFGQIFYFGTNQKLSIIVLILKNQTVENINSTLYRLLKSNMIENIPNSLLLVTPNKIRIRKK